MNAASAAKIKYFFMLLLLVLPPYEAGGHGFAPC